MPYIQVTKWNISECQRTKINIKIKQKLSNQLNLGLLLKFVHDSINLVYNSINLVYG